MRPTQTLRRAPFLLQLAVSGGLLIALAAGAACAAPPAPETPAPLGPTTAGGAGGVPPQEMGRAAGPPPQGAARPDPCVPERPPQEATLVGVVDGDTIDVVVDGTRRRVRYIGINTPERDQAGYAEATEANRRLVNGASLLLYRDVSESDRYGRLLRYVAADGRFVNLELLRQGYAQAMTVPPDVACAERFAAAEREARAAGIGLWGPGASPGSSPPPPAAPGPYREGSSRGGGCEASYPDLCLPPPPPDLDCGDIAERRFRVLPPDPQRLDADGDGIGCER
mgnify:CR=1 FL=1